MDKDDTHKGQMAQKKKKKGNNEGQWSNSTKHLASNFAGLVWILWMTLQSTLFS